MLGCVRCCPASAVQRVNAAATAPLARPAEGPCPFRWCNAEARRSAEPVCAECTVYPLNGARGPDKGRIRRATHDRGVTARTRPGDTAALAARQMLVGLCAELRSGRIAAGLSLEDAARAAGMSPSQLGRLERGLIGGPTVEQLCRAAA